MEKQNWKVGKNFSYIVSDVMPERKSYDKHDFETELDYYGGYLIAESIPDEEKAKIIAAALEMLEMLNKIMNIEDHAFTLKGFDVKRLKSEILNVIKKATE